MEEEKKDSTDQTGSEEQTQENQEQEQGVSKELQSAIAQKEHWRKKYDEAIASKEQAGETKQQPTEKKETTAADYASKSDLSKIEFQIQHRELDAEAISTVVDLSKSKGISLEEALKLPVMESYVKDLKQKADDEAANPTSGRSGGVTPPKPASEMTDEEHRAYAKKFGIN